MIPAATAAARGAGVTRLAELTRLDRLGLPVWQAIRPLGRALSVHQGKGRTDEEARLGALLEAVESDFAERYAGDGPVAPLGALPADRRPRCFDDFLLGGCIAPDQAIRWALAEGVNGGAFFVPAAIVSLDFTSDTDGPLDRASSGLATGADAEDATRAALCELIERDALTEWRAKGLIAAMRAMLDPDTIPYDWFALWRRRFAAAGIALTCYSVPAVIAAPTFVCVLRDPKRMASAYRVMHGSGCDPDPEIALFRALAEAIQSRATYIAGSRDDLMPADYASPGDGAASFAFAPPSPDGGRAWAGANGPSDLDGIVGALADAGFDRIGRIILGEPPGLCTVRMIVPGLGSLERRRRMAA